MSGPLVVSHGWIAGNEFATRFEQGWTWGDLFLEARRWRSRAVVYVLDWFGAGELFNAGGFVPDPVCALEETGGAEDDAGAAWRWRLTREGEAVSVVVLSNDLGRKAGPWVGMGPRELLDAFGAFERLCGVPWSDSVGHTAEALILATHPRAKGGTLLDRAPVMPEPAQGSTLEFPWTWRRDLTPAEQLGGYVHAFDANAQYLAAWGSVELGHGAPIHHDRPRFDPRNVGVWRVAHADRLANGNPLLPAPWLERREWFTTPTMVRMLEVCDGLAVPEILEAWTWPGHSRFLRGAAERLRDARAAAMRELEAAAERQWTMTDAEVDAWLSRKVSAVAVLAAVKDLYRVQSGRFGMAGRSPASGWARPDWGHTIRAQARVNLHRRLSGLGAAPVAIATDGLLFVDDEPDGRKFAERIRLRLGPGLGYFRHDASVPAELVPGLADDRPARLFETVGAAAAAVGA